MSASRRQSRRRWLVRGAAAAGAAAALPAFLRSSVSAQEETPKRLLVLYMPNSSIREHWVSDGGRDPANGTGVATDFTLNRQPAAFEPIRDEMTMVHGLVSREVLGDQHAASLIRFMTGTTTTGNVVQTYATGPSYDTILAKSSPIINAGDSLVRQLTVSADTRGTSNKDLLKAVSTSETALKNPSQGRMLPENRPENTFRLLFGDATPGTSMAGAPIDFEAIRARRQSILDFVKGDLAQVQARLGAEQREKLDSHLTGLSQLEKNLQARAGMVNQDIVLPDVSGLEPDTSENHERLIQSFFDLIRVGFQLDVNRVASYGYASGNSFVDFSKFTPDGPSDGVHRVTHRSTNTANKNELTMVTDWYVKRTTEFVQSLAEIPEGNGSMLDNTMIVFFCEVGQRHEHNDLPIVVIGGKNLGHPGGGRYLRYDDRNTNDFGFTLLNNLGVETEFFGEPEYNTFGLQELFTPV